jgi:recombination protein RecT
MGNLTVFNESLTKHKNALEKFKPEFQKVLPAHVTPDRIVRSVVNALSANEYLCTSATPQSVVQAAMTAAVLGLDVDNVTGQGHIVPFKGKAQFIPGYKGYITLAANSGYLVSGDVVRKADHFRYGRGLSPYLEHTPAPGGPSERGPILYAYATARSHNLPSDFRVLHIEQVNAIRDKSEGYKAFLSGKRKDSPWDSHYEAMAIKTAIRALAPELPLNVQRAAAIEGEFERGHVAHLTDNGNVIRDSSEQNAGGKDDDGQPDLVAGLGLEEKPMDDICGQCGGAGMVEDAQGKGPCPGCVK